MSAYIRAHNVLAVVLVGGEGSRLGPQTLYRTKPAVMVGPTMLASFSTSVALNCGIDKVLLASQYLPFSLEAFYSETYGSEFGHYKKIDIIGPHHNRENATRYKGTADAFYDALQIGAKHQRDYVLGLSGDHIYSYDFEKLFSVFHEIYGDDTFIVFTKKVSREDASRFGILETEEGSTKVKKFIEKPAQAELQDGQDEFDASMGIYFAPLRLWQRILEVDQRRGRDGESNFDIGGDIIPNMIKEGRVNVQVFPFDGFWADVGEPKALYETCRSIFLDRNPDIFGDRANPIGSVGEPNFYSSNDLSYFTSGKCSLEKSVVNGSIFSPGVEVSHSEVLDSILLGKTESNYLTINKSTIRNAIIDKMCNINQAEITSDDGLVVVARRTIVAKGVKINAKGNAVVASFSELVDKVHRLEKYVQATAAELYDNFGTKYAFEELVEEKNKQT
jgi:glucose-1-phosphate adenylyltransferase